MALTAGLTRSCASPSTGFGGVKALYLISDEDLTSFTLASGETGEYDTCTLAATTNQWWEYQFHEDTCEFRENVEGEAGAYTVTQEIEFFVRGLSETNRDALQSLMDESDCGMTALVKDANDIVWVVGYSEEYLKTKPVRLVTDATTTNKVFNEKPGSTITLKAISPVKARIYTGAIDLTSQ